MVQVLPVKAEGGRVHLSQRRVPKLRLLLVVQEVSVDRTALDEAHAGADQSVKPPIDLGCACLFGHVFVDEDPRGLLP